MEINTYLSPNEREILESAVIGIAGAGGLGSNVAMHLVRSGIRKLIICDYDIVNISNLNRQFYFENQIGQKKVDALAYNLSKINPFLELQLHDIKLDSSNIKTIFSSCSFVVEAFDDATSKSILIANFLNTDKQIIAASGLAGWGKSTAIKLHHLGDNLVIIGDLTTSVDVASPFSPRVGVVAAMQANTVIAKLLNKPI